MKATTVTKDTTRALELSGVLEEVKRAFEATQVSNAMRSMPVEPGVVKSQSVENKLSWFVHLAPVQLFPALEIEHPHVGPALCVCAVLFVTLLILGVRFTQVAYMLKCLHIVITMAFIYPVLAATYPTLMAIAKQYSLVKQESIYFGTPWHPPHAYAPGRLTDWPLLCREKKNDLCHRRNPSNTDGIDEPRGHVGHQGHQNRRPLQVNYYYSYRRDVLFQRGEPNRN